MCEIIEREGGDEKMTMQLPNFSFESSRQVSDEIEKQRIVHC